MDDLDDHAGSTRAAAVVVYRRPGCGHCMALTVGLRARRIPFQSVNIWRDPDAAEFVRSHAGGSETVPTVVVGGHVLVHPSARQVVAHLDAPADDHS